MPADGESPRPAAGCGGGATTVVVSGIPFERLLVGGEIRRASGSDLADLVVLRLTGSGAADGAFGGGDGLVTFDFDDQNNRLSDLLVDRAGRLLLAGTVGFSNTDALVARTLADGTLDASFGFGGWRRFEQTTSGKLEDVGALVVAADETLYVAGSVTPGPFDQQLVVTRLTAAGFWLANDVLDRHDPVGIGLIVRDAVLQGDGRLIVLGYYHECCPVDVNVFTRAYRTPALTPDTGWAGGDLTQYPINLQSNGAEEPLSFTLSGGRPLVFLDAEWPVDSRHGIVMRLQNDYVFADGFEGRPFAAWAAP